MSETIERVLFNPNNGKLAIGIRIRFIDKYPEESLGAFDNKYSLRLEPTECDGWAIDNQDGIWILVANGPLTTALEDLGEL